QVAVIEFARNVVGLADAHSTELNQQTPHPVIALITEWQDRDGTIQARSAASDLGGTMRLGARTCFVENGTLAKTIYGADQISERHRHRSAFNSRSLEQLKSAALVSSGFSRDGLVELIALPNHPWFFATQFHPEFPSNPRDGHPLFTSFV